MAYQILKQEELFDSSSKKITILKYAIIQDDNKNNYLLLKLQNLSKDIINGFTLNFYDEDQIFALFYIHQTPLGVLYYYMYT